MREIKFRVWDKEKKKIYGDIYLKWLSPTIQRATEGRYNDFGDIHHLQLNDALANNKDYTLMQFTGLLDKNGKEIYEGDVLTKDGHHNRIVIWEKDAWVAKYVDDEYKTKARLHTFVHNCEVIGNKYEV